MSAEVSAAALPAETGERPGGLGPRSRRIVAKLVRVALPAGETLPAPDESVVERIDAFIGGAPPLVSLGYRFILWALELGAVLFHLRRLTRLSDEKALRYLGRWGHARAFWPRGLFRAALTPIKVAHYADPVVSRLAGYDPPGPPAAGPAPRWLEGLTPAEQRAGETLEADVVVVGSGPGGAVVATRLAEKGLAVALLEEGRYFGRGEFNRRPFQMMKRMYRDMGMTVALGVPGIPIPLGKTVGGTSTINSGTCYRVPDKVLEEWREDYGLEAFHPGYLAPHYDELEAFLRVQPVPRAVLGKVGEVIARGSEALGYSHGPIRRNAEGCEGSGVCCFGCPTGAKRSMDVSYVPRAVEGGARLFTGARVERILRERGRAVGVAAATAAGEPLTVRASAVVVACGSIYTPLLLRKNGIGRRSGALGNNLTIHPAAKCGAVFDEEIRSWEGVPQGYSIDHFHDEGLLFEGASVPPEYGAIALPQYGSRLTELMERYAHIAFFGFLIEDTSRGKVRPGPGGTPRIHYSCNRADLQKLKRGTEILARVFFAAGARRVLSPIAGLEELDSVDQVDSLLSDRVRLKDFELSAFHPLGTCRMGPSPDRSVLDPGLETWDVEGLFVTDGSVFPSSLGVNPQLTIMAVASAAAEHVAARVGGARRIAA